MSNRLKRQQKLANMLAASRCQCGKSQRYMAQALGKSVTTIQNWESGIGCPDYLTLQEWFDVLGINMTRHLLAQSDPEIYNNLSGKMSDEDIRKSLVHYIQNVADTTELRQLSFNIFGETGSSWKEQLNMMTANNHCTLRSRVNVAQLVYDNYLMEKAIGSIICPDCIEPNLNTLNIALNKGKNSVYQGVNGYTMMIKEEE